MSAYRSDAAAPGPAGVKRLLDIAIAATALPFAFVVCLPFAMAIWLRDQHLPLYAGWRVGKDWKAFNQLKLRSMRWGGDTAGVDATPADDPRITPVGRVLRRRKIDELPQLINVLAGQMTLVGPRPNCLRECQMYSDVERHILSVRPGITDIASIVFWDEEFLLDGASDPDLVYHQVVRPWKSRFCLLYLEQQSLRLDGELLLITGLAMFSHALALRALQPVLRRLGASEQLKKVAQRTEALVPHPPPGLGDIVHTVPRIPAPAVRYRAGCHRNLEQ